MLHWVWMWVVWDMLVLFKIAKSYLGGPSPCMIVKSSKLISKLWFQSIKTELYLVEVLEVIALTYQHHFDVIHALGALTSRMANQTTSGTEVVNSLIPALNPHIGVIIQMQHKTSNYREPRVHVNSNSHKANVSRHSILPVYPLKYTHELAHSFSQLWIQVHQGKAMQI